MKHIIISLFLLLASSTLFAKQSDWRVIDSVIIPSNVTVYKGETKSGNAKYWILIQDIQVSISESNAAKLQSGEAQIELVKWVNVNTRKYKYTTRKVKTVKPDTPNIDLSKVF